MNTLASNQRAPSAVRGLRERVIQTLCFEALGLAIVSLPFAHFSGETVGDSFTLLLTLSIVVTFWSALYNTAFDCIERRLTCRVASDRPLHWRMLHAIALEATAILATWPLVVILTSLSWRDAFLAELGLTLAYVAYGYIFHLAFDHFRPVVASPVTGLKIAQRHARPPGRDRQPVDRPLPFHRHRREGSDPVRRSDRGERPGAAQFRRLRRGPDQPVSTP